MFCFCIVCDRLVGLLKFKICKNAESWFRFMCFLSAPIKQACVFYPSVARRDDPICLRSSTLISIANALGSVLPQLADLSGFALYRHYEWTTAHDKGAGEDSQGGHMDHTHGITYKRRLQTT